MIEQAPAVLVSDNRVLERWLSFVRCDGVDSLTLCLDALAKGWEIMFCLDLTEIRCAKS